ncbi:MAG TPA: hypothetical protein VLT33_01075 [Labilithrix sp.]|nr:hypothetical protein [Labilithrix sp.]
MRWALFGTLGISLAAHGTVAALFLLPRLAAPPPALDPPPQNAGETFELPAPDTAETPLANASPSPDSNAAPAPIELPDAPARPVPPSRAKPAARPSHEGRPSAGAARAAKTDGSPGSTGSTALFGAVGDRSAADLSRAFTRDFPQAASGDPIWRSAALGAAGDATVTLTLDDTGHIADVQVSGNPSAPLAQGIRRTMVLIKGRPFVSKNRVTKLRIVATISADSVHDGLHGDVFAIGGSFAEGEGSAFFALNVGRRIDLRVRGQ